MDAWDHYNEAAVERLYENVDLDEMSIEELDMCLNNFDFDNMNHISKNAYSRLSNYLTNRKIMEEEWKTI